MDARRKLLTPEQRIHPSTIVISTKDLFSKEFIKGLDIEPWVYDHPRVGPPIEGKENRGNRGYIQKARLVTIIFANVFDTIVEHLIDTNAVFADPNRFQKCLMYIGKKTEEQSLTAFAENKSTSSYLNPLECDFTLFQVLMRITTVKGMVVPVYITRDQYRRLLYKIKEGARYRERYVKLSNDIKEYRTKDIQDEYLEAIPGLTQKVFRQIVGRGFKEIAKWKARGNKIKIINPRYKVFYIL